MINEIKNQREVGVSMLELYCMSSIEHLVDDVCIQDAKVKFAKENNRDVGMIPLRTVPLVQDINKQIYKKVNSIKVSLLNERDIENGTFGWCFVCRKKAELYCRDSRIPLCSAECKDKHQMELSKLYIYIFLY